MAHQVASRIMTSDWLRTQGTLGFIRQVALPYPEVPPRKMSTKAIISTLRYLVLFNPPLIDRDIWNRAATKMPDQDESEVALHILASLSPAHRLLHVQAPGPFSRRFWSVIPYDELIIHNRSDFPLCTEADHRPFAHHPTLPTSNRDVQHAGRPQCTSPPQAPRALMPEPSVSTPPNAPAVPAVILSRTRNKQCRGSPRNGCTTTACGPSRPHRHRPIESSLQSRHNDPRAARS
ncbi:hypothetical protein BC834DRAFT_897730 [Gloeopeniophorella convolvens]|nr:hypothetical protein BC834DRAFT_897730 [Gloeopeniophorella convolvens]